MSLLGCCVSLVEHGECFQGRVMSEDGVLGRLGVRLEDGGGLQNFFLKDLTTLKVMERPKEVLWNIVTAEAKEVRKSQEAQQEDSGLASEEESRTSSCSQEESQKSLYSRQDTRKSSCSQDTNKASCSQEPVSLRGAEDSWGQELSPSQPEQGDHVFTAGSDRLQSCPRSVGVHRQ